MATLPQAAAIMAPYFVQYCTVDDGRLYVVGNWLRDNERPVILFADECIERITVLGAF